MGDSLRVVTWNVHGCVGRSGRFDPEAVAQTLVDLDADLVSLQEVDDRHPISGDFDTFQFLGEALGGCAVAARTIRTGQGDYGHLLLSRGPLSAARVTDLSVSGREPRAAIDAMVCDQQIHVIATHLGLRIHERRRQLHMIRMLAAGTRPRIVLGDFNEWRRRGLATRALCPPLREAAAPCSFPAGWPRLRLDRIWCSAELEVVSAGAVGEAAPLSDRLPVLAELRLVAR